MPALLRTLAALFVAAAVGTAWGAEPWKVGPGRAIERLSDAARMVPAGAVIEVDAGDYAADVAVWTKDDVTLRAVGGRVRLLAQGAAAEGKGIWVVRAERMTVQGFDFIGARVPDTNGAGIRFDRGSLRIVDCRFLDNQTGLLTGNDARSTLDIERSEFAYNHREPLFSHQLYVGAIARLTVTGSYFHHGQSGHLLKSRAALNHIRYNRLTDERGGTSSYELEFPNGGVAHVVGNIIEQSATSENRHLISYGVEGYRWPSNGLYLVHNTLIDGLPAGGVFLRVSPGAPVSVKAVNNLLVGEAVLRAAGDVRNNFHVGADALADLAGGDYRLQLRADVIGRAVDPGRAGGEALRPMQQYVHPKLTRALEAPSLHPGALQDLAPAK